MAEQYIKIPGENFVGGSSNSLDVATKTADYTAGEDDHVIWIDASSNTVDIDLPSASGIAGRYYKIKAIDITYAASVTPSGIETIEGASGSCTFSYLYEQIDIISDGTNWLYA